MLTRSVIAAFVLGLVVAFPAGAQLAVELKKELFPKLKKARAAGKDLGEAGQEFEAGDKALKDGLQEEAVTHFKRAKELWPPGD